MSIFNSKKEEPKKELREYYFKEDQIEEFYEFYERYHNSDDSILEKYRLWRYIYHCFPNADSERNHAIRIDNIMRPFVREMDETK